MIDLPQDNQIDVRTLERVLGDQYINKKQSKYTKQVD